MTGYLTSPMLRREREYPFDDLPITIKLIIIRAIQAAWERIVQDANRRGGRLLEEGEEVLTARLAQCLADIQAEDHPSGFSASLFQNLVREEAVASYDDRSLKKRPDLTFRLNSTKPGMERSPNSGLFVECKVVGPRHPLKDYCEKGLFRFVCGEYAWAMPCGMMIGYAGEGYTIEGRLNDYLESEGAETLNLQILPRVVSALSESVPVYETGHRRTWSRNGKSHGDITVLHLWLPLPRRNQVSRGSFWQNDAIGKPKFYKYPSARYHSAVRRSPSSRPTLGS